MWRSGLCVRLMSAEQLLGTEGQVPPGCCGWQWLAAMLLVCRGVCTAAYGGKLELLFLGSR